MPSPQSALDVSVIVDGVGLDRSAATPLHEQLYTQLRGLLQRQNLAEEALMPREVDIAEALGLSRGTVRHAISRLVSDGLVYRRSGSGTFARPHRADYSLSSLTGFTRQMHTDGRVPSSRVVTVGVEDAARRSLHDVFPPHVHQVLRIERVRLADAEPVSLETLWLPYPRFAGLRDFDLAVTSVYSTVENEFGVQLKGGAFTLDLEMLSSDLADLLDEQPGSPVFTMTGMVTDTADQPIAWVESRYRPAHFHFHLELPWATHGHSERSTFELMPRRRASSAVIESA